MDDIIYRIFKVKSDFAIKYGSVYMRKEIITRNSKRNLKFKLEWIFYHKTVTKDKDKNL